MGMLGFALPGGDRVRLARRNRPVHGGRRRLDLPDPALWSAQATRPGALIVLATAATRSEPGSPERTGATGRGRDRTSVTSPRWPGAGLRAEAVHDYDELTNALDGGTLRPSAGRARPASRSTWPGPTFSPKGRFMASSTRACSRSCLQLGGDSSLVETTTGRIVGQLRRCPGQMTRRARSALSGSAACISPSPTSTRGRVIQSTRGEAQPLARRHLTGPREPADVLIDRAERIRSPETCARARSAADVSAHRPVAASRPHLPDLLPDRLSSIRPSRRRSP